MNVIEVKRHLSGISNNYNAYCKDKDEQTLFYINQMIDLFYNELVDEIENRNFVNSLINSVYKKNINRIFSNLKDYTSKMSINAVKNMDSIINLSASNRYLNMSNISGVFVTFSNEINRNFDIGKKINTLVISNNNALLENIFSRITISDRDKIFLIVRKYQDFIIKELVNNVNNKKENLLKGYRDFIDNIMSESFERTDEVKEKNIEMITEVTYLCLKDMEYININKYIALNEKHIINTIKEFEQELYDSKIIKRKQKSNSLKDYLLSFNNTIGVKVKKIFDEMNDVVYLNNEELSKKLKDFNEIVTYIFEKDLVIDKQFDILRKEYNISSKDYEKYKEISKNKNRLLVETIKANIFNIFRDNNKLFNDIIYKYLLLKNRVDEFGNMLTTNKIKELLLNK